MNRLEKGVFVILVLPLLLFFGCEKKKQFKIGVSLPSQREERWVRDKEKLIKEAERLDVDLELAISDNDAALQIKQCEELLARQIGVLILTPHDARSGSTIVEMAHEKGVKVIVYDRLVLDCEPDVFISFDNFQVGRLQGEYLTRVVPRGNYVVFSGAPSDNNCKDYLAGAMSYIEPLVRKGDITIVMQESIRDWRPYEAMKLMEKALTESKGNIDAVLGPNDGTAGGIIQAFITRGIEVVPVTGQDAELEAARRIVEGLQVMTVFKDTRKLGEKAMETALKMLLDQKVEITGYINNGKIDVPSILLTPVTVDINNIDQVLIEGGYLEKEDVYKNVKN